MSDKLVEQFKNVSSTCVSDALSGLNNLEPTIKPLIDNHIVVGRAFTVKVRATDNLMILKGIREAQPGDVLVVDAKGFLYNASCGAFVVGLAKTLGLAGMVIDGVVSVPQENESLVLQNALEKLSKDDERDKKILKDKKSALEYIDALLSERGL